MLVEETLPKVVCPVMLRVPVAFMLLAKTLPALSTLSLVVELVWKLRKSPPNDIGFIPIYVPEAELPPWMSLGPSLTNEEVDWVGGLLVTVKFPAIMPYPEAVRFVEETDVRVDCPETLLAAS